jgi:predicted porin
MGYGLAAAYALSKRTYVYGGYEADTSEQNGRPDLDHDVFAIGVNHKF